MSRKILITGGAGFIGINTALYYLKKKDDVTIVDNFSRAGTRENIKLIKKFKNVKIVKLDIRNDSPKLQNLVKNSDIIFHFAAQVAVTTSVQDPRDDFQTNVLGTINILESARKSRKKPILIYSSTNKVYGDLVNLNIKEGKTRYELAGNNEGISENNPLDFYSPYGCSKGAADQYVHDYARIYGMRTVVFRQSCIYGPHQYGVEDQGWIAWFLIAITLNKKITIYGNGKQVRDLLHVADLINAYDLAIKNIDKTSGQIYNIGGGFRNSISIWEELCPIIEKMINRKIKVNYKKIRPGDQMFYVSDIKKAKKDFGWKPGIEINDGIGDMFNWINNNKNIIEKYFK